MVAIFSSWTKTSHQFMAILVLATRNISLGGAEFTVLQSHLFLMKAAFQRI